MHEMKEVRGHDSLAGRVVDQDISIGPDQRGLHAVDVVKVHACHEDDVAGTVHRCVDRPGRAAAIAGMQAFARHSYPERVPIAVGSLRRGWRQPTTDADPGRTLVIHRGRDLKGLTRTWVAQSEGLELGGIGYRYGMNIVVIVVIVAIVVAIASVVMKRRANQKAEELRHQAQEHRDEAKASQIAATRQEDQANATVAKAKDDLAMAEQQRNAAAVKREVAADLNVRADNIDPDVPSTRT